MRREWANPAWPKIRGVVLTTYLNAEPDPQRGTMLHPDSSGFAVLRESVARHGHRLVVFTDGLDEPGDRTLTYVQVPATGENPYWRRWRLYDEWLGQHPEVPRVWCVDATDTEMLNDPFPHMEPGRLYVGSEPWTFGTDRLHNWTSTVCPSMIDWIAEHPDDVVINCGTVGGDAALVRAMAAQLGAAQNNDIGDMGVWWRVMYEEFPGWVTGWPVHTVFLANDRSSTSGAWWRHK